MSYATIAAAAEDVGFQKRCKVALWKPAQDILNEDPETPEHQARADWANRVFTGRLNITPEQLAMQILRNTTIAAMQDPAAADDAAIEYQTGQVLGDIMKIG